MKCKCCKGGGRVSVWFCGIASRIETCPVCRGKGKVGWLRAFLKGWL